MLLSLFLIKSLFRNLTDISDNINTPYYFSNCLPKAKIFFEGVLQKQENIKLEIGHSVVEFDYNDLVKTCERPTRTLQCKLVKFSFESSIF